MREPPQNYPSNRARFLGASLRASRCCPGGDQNPELPNTIHNPGSYKLVRNLTASANTDCLVISANFVTIDLAGFTINGRGSAMGYGIQSTPQSAGQGPQGIAVRNGSISNFTGGISLSFTNGSIVEGIRVSCATLPTATVGISVGQGGSSGIARDNTVTSTTLPASGQRDSESPSTVIGNTAKNFCDGFIVFCPSNVTDNTAAHNSNQNLDLTGAGCSNTNNVAP
jgi:hypothetical protein